MTVTQRGQGAVRALQRRLAGQKIELGVFGDRAAARHEDSPLTVGEVMAVHEFGGGNVPERSWLRVTVDAEQNAIRRAIKLGAKAIYDGRVSPDQALGLLGLLMVSKIQDRINSGIGPPLSPNYLPRKLAKYPGATLPLVASSQGRNAISFRVSR